MYFLQVVRQDCGREEVLNSLFSEAFSLLYILLLQLRCSRGIINLLVLFQTSDLDDTSSRDSQEVSRAPCLHFTFWWDNFRLLSLSRQVGSNYFGLLLIASCGRTIKSITLGSAVVKSFYLVYNFIVEEIIALSGDKMHKWGHKNWI